MTSHRELQLRQDKLTQQLMALGKNLKPSNDNVKTNRPRFEVTWFKDIAERQVKEHVIDGFLGKGEFSTVVGLPGSGKSVVVTDAALHVAGGKPWHGRDVKKGTVVYFAAERKVVTERRMAAYRKRHGVTDIPLAVVGGKLDLTANLDDARSLANEINSLATQCGHPCVWIIIDTLSRTFGGGDQNYTKDMGKFVQSVDEISRLTGAHITVVHHAPWAGNRGKGAVDLDGAVDASFFVESDKGNYLLKCDGANDAEEGTILAFNLESVELDCDAKGRPTTAPVVVSRELSRLERGILPSSPTGNAAQALQSLAAGIDETGQTKPEAAVGFPDDKLFLSRELWRERYYRDVRLKDPEILADTLKKRFERAVTKLVTDKAVGNLGEWFWLADEGQGRP